MSTLRKVILAILALLCLSVLLVSLLLFTSVGNQLIWRLATEQLPQLKGRLVSGQLAEGWQFEDLGWQDEAVQFSAERLNLRWRPGALLFGSLQVDALSGEGVSLALSETSSAAPEPDADSSVGPLVLPFSLHLNQLSLDKVHFAMPQLTVALDHFASSANWLGAHLYIGDSQLQGLAVDWDLPAASSAQGTDPTKAELAATTSTEAVSAAGATPASPARNLTELAPSSAASSALASAATQTPASAKPTTKSATTERLSLPSVTLPMDISLAGLSLERVRYRQPGLDTDWLSGQLAAQFIGDQLTLQQLSLQHPQGALDLNGDVRFADDYPLTLTLGAHTAYGLPEGMPAKTLALQAKGSLGALILKASVDGPEGLNLDGSLDALDPQLPFDLNLHWAQLRWPLGGEPEYAVRDGELKAQGSLKHYEASLSSTIKALTYPQGHLTTQLQGDLKGLDLTRLAWDSEHTQAEISGKLAWQQGVSWQGDLRLNSSRLQAWVPQIQGQLALGLQSRFKSTGSHWQLEVHQLDGRGQINGHPVAMSGDLSGNDRLQWQIQELRLSSGANRLRINGQLDKQWALSGDIHAPELGSLGSGMDGALMGQVALTGNAKAPKLALSLQSSRLRWPDGSLRDLDLTGQLEPARQYAGKLAVGLGRLHVAGLGLKNIRLNAGGDAKSHELTLDFDGKKLAGAVQLQGGLNAKGWQGALQSARFDTLLGPWQLASPLAIASRAPWQRVQLGEQCWQSEPASLCISAADLSAKQGKLALQLDKFATERLAVLLPERVGWRSELGAKVQLAWRNGVPELAAKIQTGEGEIINDGEPSQYQTLQLSAALDAKQARLKLDFLSEVLGQALVDLQVQDPQGKQQLAGTLSLDNLRLYGLAPLVDALHRSRGRIDGQGRLAGSLTAPLFYGQLRLSEGELDTNLDIATVRELQAKMDVQGARADLSGSLNLGKGKMQLQGVLDWQSPVPRGWLTLDGKQLELGLAGYGRGRLDHAIRLDFSDEVRLTGQVALPWARIQVKSLPDSVVSVSPDVEVVRGKTQTVEPAATVPFYLDVTTTIGPDVKLNAMGLQTQLAGRLKASQLPGKSLQLNGEINLVEGRYRAYGQNLEIRDGKLMFSGNPDQPLLAVEAVRSADAMEDEDITVGVRVSGLATAPKVTLFSDPEMSQADKLSYLLRGRSSNASGGSGDDMMTAMLLGAGIGQAGGVVTGVAESLGFSDVALDTAGSGDDTQVNISGYIMPGLQVQYGVGVFSSISEVKVRYELMPKLYIQALSGMSQALDLFYKFEF